MCTSRVRTCASHVYHFLLSHFSCSWNSPARRGPNIVFFVFAFQESILQDSGRNIGALMAAKREFISIRDAVNQFSDGFYTIADHVRMPSLG